MITKGEKNMKLNLFDKLFEIKDKNYTRFHMPGHKGRISKLFPENFLDFDTTEIFETDNLYNPKGVILKLLNDLKSIYNTKKSFISLNGSTGSIISSIYALCKEKDEILIQRNSHLSVYNATIIRRLKINYIYPEISDNSYKIDEKELENILILNKNIKLAVFTSPDYYGRVLNVEKIVEICHKFKVKVLIDEAHGSHFKFLNSGIKSALEYGADVVINSLHKTLPALNQTSLIHINSKEIDSERFERGLKLFQSTSPSYILMMSIEKALNYMTSEEGVKKIREVCFMIEDFKKRCEKLTSLEFLKTESKDPFKLVFKMTNLENRILYDILHEEFKIDMEMFDVNYIVGICSVFDEQKDCDLLFFALEEIDNRYKKCKKLTSKIVKTSNVETEMQIYETFDLDFEICKLKDSCGEISADFITFYPPGSPVLVPGEVISERIIEEIEQNKKNEVEIIGLVGYNKDEIRILKKENL